MNNTKATNGKEEYLSKKITVENTKTTILKCLPPIIQELYHQDEYNRQLLDPILDELLRVSTQFQLGVGEGECPECYKDDNYQLLTLYRIEEKVIITNGNVKIRVKVLNHRCPKCNYRREDRAELTLGNGTYDRELVLAATAIYACGCSLEHTRGLLTGIFGVTPALSTIHNWKIRIGLMAYQLNREVLEPIKMKTIQIDELFTAVRDGQLEKTHTPVFATAILESTYGALLHVGVSHGSQTNRIIVEANLKQIKHHEPEIIVGDGCPSYPGAVAQELPKATFIRDLVHEVRNIRKKKTVKKILKTKINTYQEELIMEWKQELQKDRQKFITQLLLEYKDQPKNNQTRKIAKGTWNEYRRLERLEAEAHEQNTLEQGTLFKHCVHRYLYTAREAARIVSQSQEETEPSAFPLTTCRLEGTFRPVRSRERRSLCHRSIFGFKAFLGLFLLYHNMVGTGRGNLYNLLGVSVPNSRWNPFFRFPARVKSQTTLSPPLGTPFRQVSTRFRQQHSHQLSHPSLSKNLLIPNTSNAGSMEVAVMS